MNDSGGPARAAAKAMSRPTTTPDRIRNRLVVVALMVEPFFPHTGSVRGATKGCHGVFTSRAGGIGIRAARVGLHPMGTGSAVTQPIRGVSRVSRKGISGAARSTTRESPEVGAWEES